MIYTNSFNEDLNLTDNTLFISIYYLHCILYVI